MTVDMCYINYKNDVKNYTIQPINIWFGKSPYYPQYEEEQWFLKALDTEDNIAKDFMMRRIQQFFFKDC